MASDIEIYEDFMRSVANRTDIADVGKLAADLAATCKRRIGDPRFAHKVDHYTAQLARYEAIVRVRARLAADG